MRKKLQIFHPPKKQDGFSLIEVLIGVALIAIALIGLAQLFTMSVTNNLRANQLSTASFLCQQQIDYMRTLTPTELDTLPLVQDEQIDINEDKEMDFRRITTIQKNLNYYKVLVYPPSQFATPVNTLILEPLTHQVKAQMGTIIQR
jgi:prepilin-type N-terminal cleavage/methylation domain-containing protein